MIFWLSYFVCSLPFLLAAHGLEVGMTQRKQELSDQYHLQNARKKGAVNDALNFLISQEAQLKEKSGQISAKVDASVVQTANDDLPLCQVSVDNIGRELTFTFNGAKSAPYDHHCWLMRTRYNVAETCALEERKQEMTEIWQWDWSFASALAGFYAASLLMRHQ